MAARSEPGDAKACRLLGDAKACPLNKKKEDQNKKENKNKKFLSKPRALATGKNQNGYDQKMDREQSRAMA